MRFFLICIFVGIFYGCNNNAELLDRINKLEAKLDENNKRAEEENNFKKCSLVKNLNKMYNELETAYSYDVNTYKISQLSDVSISQLESIRPTISNELSKKIEDLISYINQIAHYSTQSRMEAIMGRELKIRLIKEDCGEIEKELCRTDSSKEGSANKKGKTNEKKVYFKNNTEKVTDVDGNMYNTITIGNQIWMKENLKVTHYRNGDPISTTKPANMNIRKVNKPKYQWAYQGNDSLENIYGRLYTWYVVTDKREVCPIGWHVPSDTEWDTLINYVGGKIIAGGRLKEAGFSHWNKPNVGADNSSGFTGLPGGYRDSKDFYGLGFESNWSSKTDPGNYNVDYESSIEGLTKNIPFMGFSVRCIKD